MWPENWPALQLFIRCQTQWRHGFNGPTGLDYGAVVAMANLYQTSDLPRVMDDLQIMESEILVQLSKEKR